MIHCNSVESMFLEHPEKIKIASKKGGTVREKPEFKETEDSRNPSLCTVWRNTGESINIQENAYMPLFVR